MCCKKKKKEKRFLLLLIKQAPLFILLLSALLASFAPSGHAQEKWVPDYNNRDTWQQPDKIMDAIGQREDIKNIITILGKKDDPGLPKGQIDIILMVHVFHLVIHNQEPLALLENIRPSLKPHGMLVLVQWDGKKMGHPNVYAYSKESVLKVIENSCFELVRTETFLPRENIYILRAK